MVSPGRAENAVNAIWKLLMRIALIVGIVYAGYRLRAIIATIFIAAIIAYVLDPLVEWLTRQKWFITIHTTCGQFVIQFQLLWRKSPSRSLSANSRVEMKQHAVRTYATLYVFVLFFVRRMADTAKLVTRPFVKQIKAVSSVAGQERLQIQIGRVSLSRWDDQAPEFAQSEKIKEAFAKSGFAHQMQTALRRKPDKKRFLWRGISSKP